MAVGARTFELMHTYVDDNPTGTVEDVYELEVRVIDEHLASVSMQGLVTVQNADPVVEELLLTPDTIDENGVVTASGRFTDAGVADTHTVLVDWGDGAISVAEVTLGVGTGTFSARHRYEDDGPYPGNGTPEDRYPITVRVLDDDQGEGSRTEEVLVRNVDPELLFVGADTRDLATSGEVELSGVYREAGPRDEHTVSIAWGDGNVDRLPTVGGAFVAAHTYEVGAASQYEVEVTLEDDDTGTDRRSLTLQTNAAPEIVDPLLSPDVINEGETVTLTGRIEDGDSEDTHTVLVDWGDGDRDFEQLDAGVGSFTLTHSYADDDPTGTLSDDYGVEVIVLDDHGGVSRAGVSVTVLNVDPEVTLTGPADPVSVGSSVPFSGSFEDPGQPDTHVAIWDFGDGTLVSTDSLSSEHVYESSGTYLVTLRVSDDDNRSGGGVSALFVTVVEEAEEVAPLYDVAFDRSQGSGWVNYVTNGEVISRLSRSLPGAEFGLPGGASELVGLEVLASAMSLGGVTVPARSLLVVNGAASPDRVYAVDPSGGIVLSELELDSDYQSVGVTYHGDRDSLYILSSVSNEIVELAPSTGLARGRFAAPVGGASSTLATGDVTLHPETGNLVVGTNLSNEIFEVDLTGSAVRSADGTGQGLDGDLSGLAFTHTGQLLVSKTSTSGDTINTRLLDVPELFAPLAVSAESNSARAAAVAADEIRIENGRFGESDPAAATFGWQLDGAATIAGGQAVLSEGADVFAGVSQTFLIPANSTLKFTLVDVNLNTEAGHPPDAFEVALTDAETGARLIATIVELTGTDAVLNVQSSGTTYFGETTGIDESPASGDTVSFDEPMVVSIDLQGALGRQAVLHFGVLGFGAADSSVVIDDVILIAQTWQNPVEPLDVNDNGLIEPVDALLVINELNLPMISEPFDGLLPPIVPPVGPPPFFDVDGDGHVTPTDAIRIINFHNEHVATLEVVPGEGQGTVANAAAAELDSFGALALDLPVETARPETNETAGPKATDSRDRTEQHAEENVGLGAIAFAHAVTAQPDRELTDAFPTIDRAMDEPDSAFDPHRDRRSARIPRNPSESDQTFGHIEANGEHLHTSHMESILTDIADEIASGWE